MSEGTDRSEQGDVERTSGSSDRQPLEPLVPGRGNYRGRQYVAELKPAKVAIRDIQPFLPFRVSRRSGIDRFAARIGFSRPIVTEDADFDHKVLVSADRDAGAKLLRDPETRRLIAALLERGTLKLGPLGLELTLRRGGDRDARAARLRAALDDLIELASRIETAGFARRGEGRLDFARVAVQLIAFLALSTCVQIGLGRISQMSHASVEKSREDALLWFGPAILLILFARAWWVAGKPDAADRMLTWCVLVPVSGGLGGWGCLLTADRWIAQAPSRSVEALVLEVSPGKEDVSVTFTSWDTVGGTESILVSASIGERLQPGLTRLGLNLSKGWLGYERVTTVDSISRERTTSALGPELKRDVRNEPSKNPRASTEAAISGLAPREYEHGEPSWSDRAEVLGMVLALPLAAVVIWALRRRRLARATGKRPGWKRVPGNDQGLEYRIFNDWLRIGPAPAPVILNVTPHSDWSRFASRIGWSRPVLSGDRDFDATVCVHASPASAGEVLLALPEARQLLKRLMGGLVRPIVRLDEDGLRAWYRPRQDLLNPLEDLVRLHRLIERHLASSPPSPALWPRNTQLALIVLLFVFVFGVGFFPLLVILCAQPWSMVSGMLPVLMSWGVGVGLVTLPIVLGIMRRRRLSAEYGAAAIPLVPFMMLIPAVTILATLNAALDDSPATVIHARLLGFDKGGAAIFDEWEEHPGRIRVVLAPQGCAALTAPCDVEIQVGHGGLGYERLIRVDAARP